MFFDDIFVTACVRGCLRVHLLPPPLQGRAAAKKVVTLLRHERMFISCFPPYGHKEESSVLLKRPLCLLFRLAFSLLLLSFTQFVFEAPTKERKTFGKRSLPRKLEEASKSETLSKKFFRSRPTWSSLSPAHQFRPLEKLRGKASWCRALTSTVWFFVSFFLSMNARPPSIDPLTVINLAHFSVSEQVRLHHADQAVVQSRKLHLLSVRVHSYILG